MKLPPHSPANATEVFTTTAFTPPGPSGPGRLRRGVALVMVLGILALVLGLSYALLRGQSTGRQLAANSDRAVTARDAAYTGMAVALDRMHQSTWAGVDTPLSATVSTGASYTVTFATGDATLTASSPDYAEYPFRVTVTSTGLAVDPDNPQVQSQFVITAVVQLVRRAVQAQAAAWTNIQPFTLYQWSTSDAVVQYPCRIEGASGFQGRVLLCASAPPSTDPRARYLCDLELMRQAGQGDFRPFSGGITWTGWRQTAEVSSIANWCLGVTVAENTLASGAPLTRPGGVTSYRLYPGGRTYTIPTLNTTYGATVSNATLSPDPLTNPLGVFPFSGVVTLGNNVTVNGVLLGGASSAGLVVSGTGVTLNGRNLPALDGSTTARQLPVLLVGDDIRFNSLSNAAIRGAVLAWDEFDIRQGAVSTQFDLRGKVFSGRFSIRARNEWLLDGGLWDADYQAFLTALQNVGGSGLYFPAWMQQQRSLAHQPLLTIRPDSSSVSYQWIDWTQPIFTRAASDSGLRWNLLSWTESS